MEDAARTLVSTVTQLAGAEFRQLRGVGGEAARLRNELATITALLRMQSEADEAAVDHFTREWMKQLREVGYDAEDCVDTYFLRVRRRRGDSLPVRWKRLLTTLWSRRRIAGDIRDLRALACSINEQHARYGACLEPLRRTAAASSASAPDAQAMAARRPFIHLAADSYAGPNQLVGIEDAATDLANKIKAKAPQAQVHDDAEHKDERPQAKMPKVFSIVGFGGLGKTTLALEVCRQLETDFPYQAQVYVSQTFSGSKDLQGLLKRLLWQIAQPKQTTDKVADPLDKIDTMTVHELRSELQKRLQDKRYLILIDDVWRISAWDVIWSNLPSSECDSRIIVTTRIDTVAKACSDANDIHHMKKLNPEDSEKLFIIKAFGSAEKPSLNYEYFEAKMTSILKKCGGLPLAIVSIASLLASYKPPEGKEMWELVERSIGSQMEINPSLEGMRQILTLSYNSLPHHLKACMMYLSIFPEDYMIGKERLLKRWIAEGLVAEKRGLTQMEVAESYFVELMSRSMIDRATDSVPRNNVGKREERCRVHDMMLEILVSKSLEANFVSLVGGHYEGMSYSNLIRRLSIHGVAETAHKESSNLLKKNVVARHPAGYGIGEMLVEHVRSLSIFDPDVINHKLLARLGEFTLLRVLDLEDCKGLGKKHMSYICRMYLLRFLSLRGTDIKVMPPRVGDLEHLQILDVRETHLKDLPDSVTKLERLEHLMFSDKGASWYNLADCSGWMLPRGINKMKRLRQVNRAEIHDPKVAKLIGELDQLQELAIYVDTRKKMDLKPVVKELASSLSKMCSLRWLDVGNFGCGKWPFVPIMEFLRNVQSPPRLLRYLKICGHLHKLPDWVGSLTDLVELNIVWTYLHGSQLFDVICKLPNLERLYLGAYFIQKYENMVAGSSQPFPKLKELTLGYSPETPESYIFEEGSMPKLEKLVVNFGDQHKRIVGIQHLTNLKEVQYSGSRGISEMKESQGQLEELNKKEGVSQQVTVRVMYEDDW